MLGSSCLTAVYTAASASQCIHIHTLHKQTLLNGGVQRWLFLTHFTNCQQESLVDVYSHNILPLSAAYSFHWFNIVCGDYIWINKTKLCPKNNPNNTIWFIKKGTPFYWSKYRKMEISRKLKLYRALKIMLRIHYVIRLNAFKCSQVLIFAWYIQAEFIATEQLYVNRVL